MIPTVALYVRIPSDLDKRIREHVADSPWPRKGALQSFVIGALTAACPVPAKPEPKAKPPKAKSKRGNR